MAVRLPQLVGLVRPMDVDKAAAGIDDPTFRIRSLVSTRHQTVQPEDARGDEIVLGRGPFGGESASRLTGLKDHTRGGACPDLLADLMKSVRGLLRILDATTAGPGRTDDVGFTFLTMEMP